MSAGHAAAPGGPRKKPGSEKPFLRLPREYETKLIFRLTPAEKDAYVIILSRLSFGQNEAKITPGQMAKALPHYDSRTIREAVKNLREKKIVGRRGAKFIAEDLSKWEPTEPRKPRRLTIVRRACKPAPVAAPDPEPVPAPDCPECGGAPRCEHCGVSPVQLIAQHEDGCKLATPAGGAPIEKNCEEEAKLEAKPELEFRFQDLPRSAKPKDLKQLHEKTGEQKANLQNAPETPLNAYLTAKWVPVIKEMQTPEIEKALARAMGETPLDWIADRLEKKGAYVARNGWRYMVKVVEEAAKAYRACSHAPPGSPPRMTPEQRFEEEVRNAERVREMDRAAKEHRARGGKHEPTTTDFGRG
jgi:hypothetical protein